MSTQKEQMNQSEHQTYVDVSELHGREQLLRQYKQIAFSGGRKSAVQVSDIYWHYQILAMLWWLMIEVSMFYRGQRIV